ncbi:MAG: SMC-Scp complex subunit ScpB [Acidimicrobiia bacterium]
MIEPRSAVEAILFVAEAPIPTKELAQVLEIPHAEVQQLLAELRTDLETQNRGVVLREVAGGWRPYSRSDAKPYLERFAATPTANRLSPAAIEALAVVAYRQPVARNQVSEIRGVDSDSALRTLERRGLVGEVGRAPGPGSAVLYGTTSLFLERMGLGSLSELPPLADHVPPSAVVETLEDTLKVEE